MKVTAVLKSAKEDLIVRGQTILASAIVMESTCCLCASNRPTPTPARDRQRASWDDTA